MLSAPDVAVVVADAGGGSTGDCAASGGATVVLTGTAHVDDPQGRSSVSLKARIRAAAVSMEPSSIDPQAAYAVRIASQLDDTPFYTTDATGDYASIYLPKLFDHALFWTTANVNTTNDPSGIGTTEVCDSVGGCVSRNGFSAVFNTTVDFEGPSGTLYVQLYAAASSDALVIVDPVITPAPVNPDVVVTIDGPVGGASFDPLAGITPDDLVARGLDPTPFIDAGFFDSTTTTSSTPSTTSTSSTTAPTTTTVMATTTTPTTSTTTTTVPTACPLGATFPSVACRVDELLALLRASDGLGALQRSFVARAARAERTVTAAAQDCAAGASTRARSALAVLDRQMTIIRSRTRTNRARKVIPSDLAAEIADAARAIGVDVRALRASLVCP